MRLHGPLISIASLFMLPVIAASMLLANKHTFNLNTIQHGELVQAPAKIMLENIEYIAGQDYAHKWTVLYIQPQICAEACQAQKNILHNLHIALGPAAQRVAIVASTQQSIKSTALDNDLLILDPQGLYIMRYTGTIPHSGLLKDLRRLLKYSHA